MSESWFAQKEDPKEATEEVDRVEVNEPLPDEDLKPKPKRSGFNLFRAKAKSPDPKKGGFSLFRKKSPPPLPDEEENAENDPETSKQGGFSLFGRKSDEEDFEENVDECEEVLEDGVEEEEEEEESGSNFEDSMRNVLRKVGVEVEDDDDWKQMVIKTRLTLKEFKDSLIGNEGTKEERTKRLIVVVNDDNVVELQFRLDFSHYTPPNLDIEDEDEIEINPDLVPEPSIHEDHQLINEDNHSQTLLETPVNPEKPAAKKKRLKRIIKAITKAQKLNKKRLKRLEEKQLIKAQEEKAREAEEANAEEEVKAKAEEEAKGKEEAAKAEETGEEASDVFEDKDSEEDTLNAIQEEDGEVVDGEEEEDTRSLLGKIEDQTGIRIIIRTDGLEKRLNEEIFVPLQEYKEIFFGPDLTEEEKAELEKMASDEKEFYVHLKLLFRKKTWEEKEAERIAEEEEAKRKAMEEAGDTEEADEDVVLEKADEKKREKRKELEEKQSWTEGDSEATSVDYDNVQIS